jgi:hypothetical protein
VSAWGSNVATLGYGDMYNGVDPANASGRWVRSYANSFGGSSAATAQIAGLVSCLQGFAKQFYGIPFTPGQMRALISSHGYPQCDVLLPALHGPPDNPCLGDWDPDAAPARISGAHPDGAYPIPMECAEWIILEPMGDGSGTINDICVLRGSLLFGNAVSIRLPEDNALVVQSQYTVRGDHASSASCPQYAAQIGAANYIGNGEVVDLLVRATNPVPGANVVNVQTKVGYPGVTSVQMVELWDWARNRWSIIGSAVMDASEANICGASGAGIYKCFAFNSQRAATFIRSGDNMILCRVYITGLVGNGDLGGWGTGAYNGRIDWIDIQTSIGGGGFIPTGGGVGP